MDNEIIRRVGRKKCVRDVPSIATGARNADDLGVYVYCLNDRAVPASRTNIRTCGVSYVRALVKRVRFCRNRRDVFSTIITNENGDFDPFHRCPYQTRTLSRRRTKERLFRVNRRRTPLSTGVVYGRRRSAVWISYVCTDSAKKWKRSRPRIENHVAVMVNATT